jgi:hypothetical protein
MPLYDQHQLDSELKIPPHPQLHAVVVLFFPVFRAAVADQHGPAQPQLEIRPGAVEEFRNEHKAVVREVHNSSERGCEIQYVKGLLLAGTDVRSSRSLGRQSGSWAPSLAAVACFSGLPLAPASSGRSRRQRENGSPSMSLSSTGLNSV